MTETWNEPDPDVLDRLTQHGCFAADRAAIDAAQAGATAADQTRAGVRAALRMLLANDLIEARLVAGDEWVLLDPPDET